MNIIHFLDGPSEGVTLKIDKVYGDIYRVWVRNKFCPMGLDQLPETAQTIDYRLECVVDPRNGYEPSHDRCFLARVAKPV